MSSVNLLPPEVHERQRIRRRTTIVIAGAVVAIALLAGFFLIKQMEIARLDRDIAAQESENAQIQSRIAQLQRFELLQQQLVESRSRLTQLLANEVLFSQVLRDVSLVIPGSSWLDTMSASINETAGAPGEVPTSPDLVGSLTFTGNAFDHPSVALWLVRIESVQGFVNAWISTSAKSEPDAPTAQFSSTVDLSKAALSNRYVADGGPA